MRVARIALTAQLLCEKSVREAELAALQRRQLDEARRRQAAGGASPASFISEPGLAALTAAELVATALRRDARGRGAELLLGPLGSLDELRRRYKLLALRLHPDKCSLPAAKEAFGQVHAAFRRAVLPSGI